MTFKSDPDTSISAVYTPIAADFTRITSFGGIETLRQYMIPKSDDITIEVVREKLQGDSYIVEYIIQAPNSPKRHIATVFALRPQESGKIFP